MGEPGVARLRCWVRPSARRRAIAWSAWRNAWEISVDAPPIEGAANEALGAAVAEFLLVPRARVRLVRGARGRLKELRVDGMTDVEATERLRRAASGL